MSSNEINPVELLGNWFNRRVSDIREHFEEYDISRTSLTHHISLWLIIIVAFVVRLFPLILGWDPTIKAFDPWMQLRAAEYIQENGLLNFLFWRDEYSWYPGGRDIGTSLYIGVPLAIVFVYNVMSFFGFNITLQFAAYFVPIIFGTITVYFSYLLGKELISARAGLFAAMIMAVTPAFVSRSIGGFVDNESVGVLFTVMTFYFFGRAFLRDSNRSAVAAGISMFLLGSSWGAFRFAYDIFPVVALVMVVTGKFSTRFLKAYMTTLTISTMLMIMVPRVGGEFIGDFEGIAPLGFVAFMVLFGILQSLSRSMSPESFRRFILVVFVGLLVVLGGTLAILTALNVIDSIGDKFISVLLPGTRNGLPLIDSVSEHLPLAWGSLYANLSTLVFFIPLGIYFAIRQPTEKNIFLLTFGLVTIYFSGSMVRLLLLLAPAAAVLTALAIDNLLMPYAYAAHGRIKLTKITMSMPSIGAQNAGASYFIVFVLMMLMLGNGVNVAATRFASPEVTPGGSPEEALTDWLEAFDWMQTYTSFSAYSNADNFGALAGGQPPVMMSWWDYGYYITGQGNTISLVDNATFNSTQIGVVGTMLMWNATASINLMYKYNVKYVLVVPAGGQLGLGSDIGKSIWMMRIAEQYTPQYGVQESDYFDDQGGGYLGKYFDSVLWKLMAFHSDDMGEDQGAGRPPFCTGQGCSATLTNLVPEARENQVNEGDPDMVYFREAFRSSGLRLGPSLPGIYPLVRIYEVVYPEDIEQRVAEFDETMQRAIEQLEAAEDDE